MNPETPADENKLVTSEHHGRSRIPVGHPRHLDQTAADPPRGRGARPAPAAPAAAAGHRTRAGQRYRRARWWRELGRVAGRELGRVGAGCRFPAGQPGAQRAAVLLLRCLGRLGFRCAVRGRAQRLLQVPRRRVVATVLHLEWGISTSYFLSPYRVGSHFPGEELGRVFIRLASLVLRADYVL